MTDDNPPYAVGYGKPPVAGQFQAGRSGNPKGRPRKPKVERSYTRRQTRRDIISIMEQLVTVRSGGKSRREPAVTALLQAALTQALRGDRVSQRWILKIYAQALAEHEDQLPNTIAKLELDSLERKHSTRPTTEEIEKDLNYVRKWTRHP